VIGILIVEDERIVAIALEKALRRMRYSVTGITDSGEAALDKLAQSQSDLVLMDIRLRGELDGIQTATLIHERHGIPVVYLTAYADEEILQRAKVTEAFGYILKPFEERDLRVAIEMALYKHSTERALRERDRWLSATLTRIDEAVIRTNDKDQVTYVNAAAEALLGWQGKKTWGMPIHEAVPVSDADGPDAMARAIVSARREGRAASFIAGWLHTRQRGSIPVEGSVALLFADRGASAGTVLILRDTSARQQAREALQDVEAQYQTLLESTEDAVLLLDPEGSILRCNAPMAKLLAQPEEALVGQVFFDLDAIPEANRLYHRQVISRLATGEALPPFTMRLEQGGTSSTVDISFAAVRKAGRVQAVQLTARLAD